MDSPKDTLSTAKIVIFDDMLLFVVWGAIILSDGRHFSEGRHYCSRKDAICLNWLFWS